MDKVALLAELRAMANNPPDFTVYAPTSKLHLEWIAKTGALLKLHDRLTAVGFTSDASFLTMDLTRAWNVGKIMQVLHNAIAELELQVPSTTPQQVFGPGAVYDFMKALRDLLKTATNNVFLIDPYLDADVFDAYVSPLSSGVGVRLFANRYAPAVAAALHKYVSQTKRPVEARSSNALHDRAVFLDSRSCWVMGQSIKDAAASKMTYLAPLAADAADLKLKVLRDPLAERKGSVAAGWWA